MPNVTGTSAMDSKRSVRVDGVQKIGTTQQEGAYSALLTLSGQAGGATCTFTLLGFPLNVIIKRAYLEGVTAITFGGTTTGVQIKVGDTADDDELLANGAVTSLAVGAYSQAGGLGVKPGMALETDYVTAGLKATGTATGGAATFAEITAGAVRLHIEYDVPKAGP